MKGKLKEAVFVWCSGFFLFGVIEGVSLSAIDRFATLYRVPWFDSLHLRQLSFRLFGYLFCGLVGGLFSHVISLWRVKRENAVAFHMASFLFVLIVIYQAFPLNNTTLKRFFVPGAVDNLLVMMATLGMVTLFFRKVLSRNAEERWGLFMTWTAALSVLFVGDQWWLNDGVFGRDVYGINPNLRAKDTMYLFLGVGSVLVLSMAFRRAAQFLGRLFVKRGSVPFRIASLLLFLWFLFVFYPTLASWAKPSPQKQLPNLLWIVMDTVRADHLSSYGYPKTTTPRIDDIAAEGVLFERMMSPAPYTLPSHASMFTGLYQYHHGVGEGHPFLDPSLDTIAAWMTRQGYQTVGFSNNPWVGKNTNLARGFEEFYELWLLGDRPFLERFWNWSTGRMRYGAEPTNKLVERWIRLHPHSPFFVFINYVEPHLAYQYREEFTPRFMDRPYSMEEIRGVNQNAQAFHAGKVRMVPEDFRILTSLYDGEICYLDREVGKLVDFLKESRLLDNTILLITSDHGENLGDHGLMNHQFCLYQTLLHVPCILRYPKMIPAGLRIHDPVSLVDLFPTLMALVGGKGDLQTVVFDGENLSSLLGGDRSGKRHSPILAEYDRPVLSIAEIQGGYPDVSFSRFDRALRSIQKEGYKYIWASSGDAELYFLEKDPFELKNLAVEIPEKGEVLGTLLPQAAEPRTPSFRRHTREVEEGLRALGYLH